MATVLIDELPLTSQDPNYKGWVGGVQCPSPYHDDKKPSASMNVEKGLVYCHACGTTSIVKEYYSKILEEDNINAERKIIGEHNNVENSDLEELPNRLDDRFWMLPDWWFERGFNKISAEHFNVYCINGHDICVPIYDFKNNYAGYVIRKHSGSPKYLYGAGSKVGSVLFGIDKINQTNRIIIVEGVLDAIWLKSHGYPALAMFGCSLSNEQINLLESLRFSEIYLMPDNDEVGREIGLKSMKEKLGERFLNYYEIDYPGKYKDPQDIPGSELPDIILYKESLDFSKEKEAE